MDIHRSCEIDGIVVEEFTTSHVRSRWFNRGGRCACRSRRGRSSGKGPLPVWEGVAPVPNSNLVLAWPLRCTPAAPSLPSPFCIADTSLDTPTALSHPPHTPSRRSLVQLSSFFFVLVPFASSPPSGSRLFCGRFLRTTQRVSSRLTPPTYLPDTLLACIHETKSLGRAKNVCSHGYLLSSACPPTRRTRLPGLFG